MKQDLQEILDAIDIGWVLDREGVDYRSSYGRSGLQLNARTCPFCANDAYKVYINADSGVGNCFSGGCPQGSFSKWTLLKGLYEQNNSRALIDLLKSLAQEQGWRPKRAAANDSAMLMASLELPDSVAIEDMATLPEYLARRGVGKEIASYFGLRMCNKGRYEFPRPDGSMGWQTYDNRILTPLLDLDGSLVSFQGRDTTGEAEQRYLFPPGFAASGAYLFNGFNWAEGMDGAIVSEGAFDVIGTKMAIDGSSEWRNWLPIGTFGMHLSSGNPEGKDQMGRLMQLKGRGLKKVIILWDGELKAQAAAIQAALLMLSRGLEPSIAMLPLDKDPGAASSVEILQALARATPIKTRLDAVKFTYKAKDFYAPIPVESP